jgi:hypothetical protein
MEVVDLLLVDDVEPPKREKQACVDACHPGRVGEDQPGVRHVEASLRADHAQASFLFGS